MPTPLPKQEPLSEEDTAVLDDYLHQNDEKEKPFLSDEDIKVLKEGPLRLFNAADQNMFLHQCQITRLHPLTGQIWARPEKEQMDKDGKYIKMLVITGIQGILSVADRSGVYDGSSPIEWCGDDGQWLDVWLKKEVPSAARATTWRKDHSRPEVAIVRWKAVANTTWDNPRNFWVKMPDYMIGKCALAASLRKLFPNLLSGIYESGEIAGGVPDMMEMTQSALEADIAAQKARIAEDVAATERLKAQGVHVVESKPAPARDPVKEVEPVMPADKQKLGQPDDEPDDLDMTPSKVPDRDPHWWRTLSCDPIKNSYYTGKTVEELSYNLLRQAVEKWVPKVRSKKDATDEVVELADALEIALPAAEKAQGEMEANLAAKSAEGAQ
jgi:phage recombination protein Bet